MLSIDRHLTSLIRNSGWLAGGGLITASLAAGQSALLARDLGSAAFGELALAVSLAGIVLQFADFRTWEAAVRLVPEGTSEGASAVSVPMIQGLLLVDLLAGLAATALVWVLADPLAGGGAGAPTLVMLLRSYALALPWILIWSGTCLGVLRLLNQFRLLAAMSIVVSLVQFGLVAAVVLGGYGIRWVIAVLVTVEVAHALVSLGLVNALVRKRGGRLLAVSWDLIRENLGRGRVVLGHGWLSGTIKGLQTRLDIPLLAALSTPSAVGYYKVALDVAGIISKLGNPIQQAVLPVMVDLEKGGDIGRLRRLAVQTSLAMSVPVVPTMAVMIVLAPQIMTILAGPEYTSAGPVLALLAVGIGINTILVWSRPLLVARMRVRAANIVALFGVLLQVSVLLSLAAVHGALAAGAASAAMYTFTSLASSAVALW